MKTELTSTQKEIITKRIFEFKDCLVGYSEENFNNFLEVSIYKNSLPEEILNDIGFVKVYNGKYADTYTYEEFLENYKKSKKYRKLEITFD